ncbi:MAG TPA: hypothetical protein VK253_03040 [Candidatus Binatia bacterium]|nr:hypothetical protein [Candidatus Binatia bacterium]
MKEPKMRKLSPKFMNDLTSQEGILYPLLEQVKADNTLMLAIRKDYINIYYRGGNILKVNEHSKKYGTYFDKNYNISKKEIPTSPAAITNQSDSQRWVDSFGQRKNIMDAYFSRHPKAEREFQQLVARENTNSTISNSCEYYITDIEVTDPGMARFDIAAVRWLAKDRKNGKCKPALFEMKYSDGALGGKAGLIKHLKNLRTFIEDTPKYNKLLETMVSQFNQLDKLGLLRFNKGTTNAKIKLDPKDPEVIFVLANHNPRSVGLGNILDDSEIMELEKSAPFDLRFYVATFAGYGLHARSMKKLKEFQKIVGQTK